MFGSVHRFRRAFRFALRGWRVEQETDKQFYACLTSQLCDVQYVDASDSTEEVQSKQWLWALAEDIEEVVNRLAGEWSNDSTPCAMTSATRCVRSAARQPLPPPWLSASR